MATVVQLAKTLEEAGALDNAIIVAAPADEAAPIKFLAPYAGCAMAITAENLADEAPNLIGCLLDGAEDLGEVTNVRLTRDGFTNAMIVGANGRDILGLPSEVTAYRV